MGDPKGVILKKLTCKDYGYSKAYMKKIGYTVGDKETRKLAQWYFVPTHSPRLARAVI